MYALATRAKEYSREGPASQPSQPGALLNVVVGPGVSPRSPRIDGMAAAHGFRPEKPGRTTAIHDKTYKGCLSWTFVTTLCYNATKPLVTVIPTTVK